MIIELTRGQVAIVEESDYGRLSQWSWYAQSDGRGGFYAARKLYADGRAHTIPMHRQLLGLVPGDGLQGDHVNGNTLDNRRCNLRVVTQAQNKQNRKRASTNKSGYKGVWLCPRGWRAQIAAKGKRYNLGLFRTAEEASDAYAKASIEMHGKFSRAA